MHNSKKLNILSMKFTLPAILVITIFSFIPMIQSFILSFQTGKGIVTEFGGLDNYRRLFNDPVFFQALKNTLLFLVIQVPLMTVLALIAAAMLNDKKLKFRGYFRVFIFLPCVTSLVSYSVLFKSLFSSSGLVNDILLKFNLIDVPVNWLLDPFWARVIIILALTWRWTGYDMIFFLAAMQNIDDSIYEAARLDGATGFRQFTSITVPMLKPIILLTSIMSTNGTLQLFDEVVNLTDGGPNNATITISKYIYDLSFKFTPNFGYAATVSYAVVVMVAVLSFIQFKVTNREG